MEQYKGIPIPRGVYFYTGNKKELIQKRILFLSNNLFRDDFKSIDFRNSKYLIKKKMTPSMGEICPVSNIDRSFNDPFKGIDAEIKYFIRGYECPCFMRYQKFAAITMKNSGNKYVIYQRSIEYSMVLEFIDVQKQEKYTFGSLRSAIAFLNMYERGYKYVPLFLNTKDKKLKRYVNKILKGKIGGFCYA